MLSRSIRWSLVSPLLLAGCLVPTAVASDDSPNIDLLEDPLAVEFSRKFEQRMLPAEAPYNTGESRYVAISPEQIIIPDPVVIPPEVSLADETVVVAPAPPAVVEQAAPEWLLYQGNLRPTNPEDQLFERINTEYAEVASACIPGVDCPLEPMQLPAWPDEPVPEQAPFEIFETDLISPFAPIPELSELPFPTPDA